MRVWFVFIGVLLSSQSLVAQTKPQGSVDPTFHTVKTTLEQFGPDAGLFNGTMFTRTDGVAGSLRFTEPLNSKQIADLAVRGIEFEYRTNQQIKRVGAIYPAFIPWDALSMLHTMHNFVRAEVAWSPIELQPLDVTNPMVGGAQTAQRPPTNLTGSGVVIADIDSGLDVLHPHFFFADGGAFRWIDVDQSGDFSPGDGVDLDMNNEIDRTEMLGFIEGATVAADGTTNLNDGFQTDIDWLFADRNEDGVRNSGVEDGFTEEDPGYGEPIFVADDANKNGVLDVNENLIRLATSKIRKFVTSTQTFERGVDLIQSATDKTMLDLSRHGTAVTSIAIGGQLAHRRIGIAPGAEFIMFTEGEIQTFEQTRQLGFITDAVDDGANILLHEWTNAFTAPHDGSGNIEAAMDTAAQLGVVQINPVGNLNISEKHTEITATTQDVQLRFEISNGFTEGGQILPFSNVYASLFWSGDAPTFLLRSPADDTVALLANGPVQTIGNAQVMTEFETTSRGTNHLVLHMWTLDESNLDIGTWALETTNATVGTTFVGRIADQHSSWLIGVRWEQSTRDSKTVVFPSTADSAFGIGAFGGRNDDDFWDMSRVGQLRNFSGRGPRIDGAPVVDLVAPDDPFAAIPGAPAFLDVGYGRSWFTTFGGTSGAGPHVAGALALLMENSPGETTEFYTTRLTSSADTSTFDPDFGSVPNVHWGHGRLNIYRAIFDEDPPSNNAPPQAELVLVGQTLDASRSSDPDGDDLFFRFDSNHDGEFETGWQRGSTFEASDVGAFIRVDVKDVFGATSGVITTGQTESLADGDDSDMGEPIERPPKKDCECRTTNPRSSVFPFLILICLFYPRFRRS